MKRRLAMLSDVCEINPAVAAGLDREDFCSFVPMEAVDDFSGRIVRNYVKPIRDVAKGYTPFAEDDVIVAKITPCMENGKAAIARNLRNGTGFGSTEFHVLRKSDEVIPEWLYYFWRYTPTRINAEKTMRGSAGQKRVPADYLETLKIPLPDLAEQKRIAAILERADRLRRLRRYGLEMAETILPAAFPRMFGDTGTLMRKWESKLFGELLTTGLRNGISPSNAGTITARVLTLSAITRGVFDSSASKFAPFMAVPPAEKRVSAADFLICRGNGNLGLVGRGRFPPHDIPDCVFPDTMIAAQMSPSLICKQFVEEVWKSPAIRRQIEAAARTTNGTHKINQEVLEEIQIPVPPLPIQQKFAVLAEREERTRRIHRESLRQAEHLFQALLQRAFTSGL